MLTRLVVSLAFVALMGAPTALAGGDCPFGHYKTTHTADTQASPPQSTDSPAEPKVAVDAAPQTVVDAPVVQPVTVATAPASATTQD